MNFLFSLLHKSNRKTNKNRKLVDKKPIQYTPIVFKNSPTTTEKDDLFGFYFQAEAILKAIQNDSNIIGIIGDYGTGKSSLTEILKTKLTNKKYRKVITINLWDSLDSKQSDSEKENITLSTKSFLYQLAFANNNKNKSFAKYINQRLSKNYGKISLSIASKITTFLLFLSGVLLLLYFIFKGIPESLFCKKIEEILELSLIAPIFLLLSISILFCIIIRGNFVFSLWDSQGKLEPDSSDIFEIYREISGKLVSCTRKKQVVYIEDLDRIKNANTTRHFLKELYRFVNLLPVDKKNKIVYIVSLKSEEVLDPGIGELLYSKIFDYTLNVKPIHNENINDVLIATLNSNFDILTSHKNNSEQQKAQIKEYVRHLYWIQQGESLTIREIKDRLNDTFILYFSLVSRQENADVQLCKCAAVVYLQRRYPIIWVEIIKNENLLAQIIHKTYLLTIESTILAELEKLKNINTLPDELRKKISYDDNLSQFILDFCKMIIRKDIEDDFFMYFYNYPKNSYIMNTSERLVTNHLVHSDTTPFEEKNRNTIEDALLNIKEHRSTGQCIEKNLATLIDNGLAFPRIILEFELLFNLACERKYYDNLSSLLTKNIIGSDSTINYTILQKVLQYNIKNSHVRDQLIKNVCNTILTTIFVKSDNITDIRKQLIIAGKKHELLFSTLFISPEVNNLISSDEVKEIADISIVLKLINFQIITDENFNETFSAINTLEIDEEHFSKLNELYDTITDKIDLKESLEVVLDFLIKYKFVNHKLLVLCLQEAIKGTLSHDLILRYLDNIDLKLLNNDEFELIDNLRTEDIKNKLLLLELLNRQLMTSLLLSKNKSQTLDSNDLDNEWFIDSFISSAPAILNKNQEVFIKIRTTVLSLLNKDQNQLTDLYHGNYPMATYEEILLTSNFENGLYYLVDHSRIDSNNCIMISNLVNDKHYSDKSLYEFFVNLFSPDNENYISSIETQRAILEQIDFSKIRINSLDDSQFNTILEFFSNAYQLDTPEGALLFMETIHCLVPQLEKIIIDQKDNSLNERYVELVNRIKTPSTVTIELLKNIPINSMLVNEITDILYSKGYFLRYIIGTILRDKKSDTLQDVPIDKIYNVFCTNDLCVKYIGENIGLIKDFVESKVIFNSKNRPSHDRLVYFYNIPQTYELVVFIMSQLVSIEDKKNYLTSSKPFATLEDSNKFSRFIVSPEQVQIFIDDVLFYNAMWYKLWIKTNKSTFTTKINKQLGTNYSKPSEI